MKTTHAWIDLNMCQVHITLDSDQFGCREWQSMIEVAHVLVVEGDLETKNKNDRLFSYCFLYDIYFEALFSHHDDDAKWVTTCKVERMTFFTAPVATGCRVEYQLTFR